MKELTSLLTWHEYDMEKPETWPKENGKYYLVALKDKYRTNVKAAYLDGNFKEADTDEIFENEKYITHWAVFPEYPSHTK